MKSMWKILSLVQMMTYKKQKMILCQSLWPCCEGLREKKIQSNFRVFGLEDDVPFYINFNDVFELISGAPMLNISIIQLWCM